MAVFPESIMETIIILKGIGWKDQPAPWPHRTLRSAYVSLSGTNFDLSPVLTSRRWSAVDVSKNYSIEHPERYSIACCMVDEKLGSVFGLTLNPNWAIIVPRDYERTKRYNVRSIAEFFHSIIKGKIDQSAQIYEYSDYMALKDA